MIISFRQPDPYVEIDGKRYPHSDYPELKVLRHGLPIPGLVEINPTAGWITLRHPAEYQWWLSNPATPEPAREGDEWQESTTNCEILGAGSMNMLVTGIDMRCLRQDPARTRALLAQAAAAAKAKAAARPPKPRIPAAPLSEIRLPPSRVQAPPKVDPVEPTITLPPVADAAVNEATDDWFDQMDAL